MNNTQLNTRLKFSTPGPRPAPAQQQSAPIPNQPQCYSKPAATTLPNGQHVTPNGRASTINRGMTLNKRIKVEKAARLVATGLYTDKMIADHIGVTPQYISQLKTTKEFQAATIACMSGILNHENQVALETAEARRAELESMVPMALMQLRNLALSRNPSIALKANLEILDREGNLAKVSKTSVTLNKPEDLTLANKTGSDIMAILRGAGIDPLNTPDGSIDGDPITGIAPGFTVSAAEAKVQAKSMQQSITEKTLDEIDASTSTVQ